MPTAPSVLMVFIAGLATVITPCVLPILPAVLSGSVGSRLRPIAIVTGMSLTFTLMGILISAVASFTFFAEYLRWFSMIFIISMGVILFENLYEKRRWLAIKIGITGVILLLISFISLFTDFWYILSVKVISLFIGLGEVLILSGLAVFTYNELIQIYMKTSSSVVHLENHSIPFFGKLDLITPKEKDGLIGGFFLGTSLGTLWIPSVGPTLSSVFAYLAGSTNNVNLIYGTILLIVFSLGFCLPLLMIVISGKRISNSVSTFAKRGQFFKKVSGIILILVGLIMFFSIDRYLETLLRPYFPVYI